MTRQAVEHWLISRVSAGTGGVRFRLKPPEPVYVGRSPANQLVLADPAVSREHAVLEWHENDDGTGHWRISDQASSSGTRVNGVALAHFQSLRLEPHDRVDLGPVALEYVERAATVGNSTLHTMVEDVPPEQVEPVQPAALTGKQLEAVLDASHQIHMATTEAAVCDCAVHCLVKATGFPDIAFVRPSVDGGEVQVLACAGEAAKRRFSRTVLRRARGGPVIISDARTQDTLAGTLVGLDLSRVICVPVSLSDDCFGLLYLSDRGRTEARVEMLASLAQSVAHVSALALSNLRRLRMSQRLEAERQEMFNGTLQALIAAIDAKDPYTRGHSARVSEFAYLIAKAHGLAQEECERARLCGMVHDIGKIGVSEAILCKADQLTEEEFRLIAAHPEIGHSILQGIPQMADILPGVLEHHERFDGTGYPHGLAGSGISLLGRLVCIADAFDAMTTSRTYRVARTLPDAMAEVKRCAGTHFDPELAEALQRVDVRELERVMRSHTHVLVLHDAPPAPARPYTELRA